MVHFRDPEPENTLSREGTYAGRSFGKRLGCIRLLDTPASPSYLPTLPTSSWTLIRRAGAIPPRVSVTRI
jgi:hypothetical protein